MTEYRKGHTLSGRYRNPLLLDLRETLTMTLNESNRSVGVYLDFDSGFDGAFRVPGEPTVSVNQASSRRRSGAWDHFVKAANYASTKKASCTHCSKSYVCSGGSTRNMLNHVKNAHPDMLIPTSAGARERSDEASGPLLYSEEAFKNDIVGFFTTECIPFTVVDSRFSHDSLQAETQNRDTVCDYGQERTDGDVR